jgi:shikimate dehydrogenase
MITIPPLCCSVAGAPSPLGVKLHDAGYRARGLDYKYVAIGAEDVGPVIDLVRALGVRGLGVSMPFKQDVIGLLDEVSDDVRSIGACNTVVNDDGHLSGYNTDWTGALRSIDEVEPGPIPSAVIIGAGGVSRAIAYGLKSRGMEVFIAARSTEVRRHLVAELGLDGDTDIENQGKFDVALVVNATPIATLAESPVDLSAHPRANLLFDVVFQTKRTPLLDAAADRGWKVVPGWRMLLHQAVRQFEMYTGKDAPLDEMAQVLADSLG